MCNKQKKKATVDALDLMIRHADKGPSGFGWMTVKGAVILQFSGI